MALAGHVWRTASSWHGWDGASAAVSKALGQLQTADYAEGVLRVHGPLYIRELTKRMREEGWTGNPSDTVAAKTVFNILANKPDRFQNTGKNIWTLVEKKP